MKKNYFLVIDEGTTGTRAVITDRRFHIVSFSYTPICRYTPQPDYVEEDCLEIYEKSIRVCKEAMEKAGICPEEIISLGITNQRNTSCIWSRSTGLPLSRAIIWQDTRTSDLLKQERKKSYIRDNEVKKCGRAYVTSSAVIILKWLQENCPQAARAIRNGEALYGSIDTWLIYKLTGGRTEAMSYSNASSLGIYDFETDDWCCEVLAGAGIPRCILPELCPEASYIGETEVFGGSIPITCAVGDQQSSMFAQECRQYGQVKATNGTGTFFDINIGDSYRLPIPGMATMVAWDAGGKKTYLYEGMLPATGAAIDWLIDGIGIISSPQESSNLAFEAQESSELIFINTLAGAFVPVYDPYARGTIFGITQGTTRADLVRAVLEGIAYGFADIMETVTAHSGIQLQVMRIDGGVSKNDFLAQRIADFVGCPIERQRKSDLMTALGAAQLAAVGAGTYTLENIPSVTGEAEIFAPLITEEQKKERLSRYRSAVRRAAEWGK